MSEPVISNVSDTARWVAVYRAWESARPDALFRDPYADLLAGERGRSIAAHMPRSAGNGWPLIARTKLIDDRVEAAVGAGCRCIVNLAAGLDTRPYRLELPPTLQWIEADLPAIIDEKERLLGDAQPHCRLKRIKIDLKNSAQRIAMLQDAGASAAPVLVITEGLLVYLDEIEVRALAADLLAQDYIRWWVIDLASPAILHMMQKQMGAQLANSPMKFAPPKGVAFFEATGWKVTEMRSMLRAAAEYKRLPWFMSLLAKLPAPNPRELGRAYWSAVVQLEPA
jgi:methyltransferase (TIGR00027 family)